MHLLASALESQMSDLLSNIGPILFYIVVWGLIFAGTAVLAGVFVPFITGDSLLFAAGLIAASSRGINIVILALGVGVAAFFGDQIGFVIGRQVGASYLDKRKGARLRSAIARTERFYQQYGWWAVVVARFMPLARAIVPAVAGIGRMNYYKFLSANLVGSGVWGVGMTFVGYFAASNPAVKGIAYVIGFGFISASLIVGFRTWRADKQQSAAAE